MLRSITQFSVRYPVTVSMIIFATLLLGYISFGKLGIDLFPNLNSPRLYIEVKSGERPPEEMEDKFVDRMESLAIRQNGVVNVSSVSRVGVAQIEVEYNWEKDMNEAFLDLSKALAFFNQDAEIDELSITQFDPNAKPVMLVAFRHRDSVGLNELRSVAENYVRNELIRLEGIADVQIDGAEEIEVLVETNEYLLKSYNVDLATISSRINSYNQSISGGSIVETGRRYIVRGLSELKQIDDLGDVIIRMGAPGTVSRWLNVCRCSCAMWPRSPISPKEMENAVTINGEPCVGLSIYKEMRFNTVRALENLRQALDEMEQVAAGFYIYRCGGPGDVHLRGHRRGARQPAGGDLPGGVRADALPAACWSDSDRQHRHPHLHHRHICADVFHRSYAEYHDTRRTGTRGGDAG
jgi:hydrophobic/amphiphilic exporter-1 (mainly G- bacteria), HAE1 family